MASPQTIVRDGSGAQTVTYQLPPGLFQYIESVLVELSNGAVVAVRPTLKVETVNGQVMATKRQGESIPAGDTGTATWALRLDDEGGGGGIDFDTLNVGDWLSVETTTAGAPFGAGVIFSVGAGDFDVIALAGQIYLDGSATSIFSEDFDMVIDSHEAITIFSRGAGANVWDIVGTLAILCGDNFDISLTAGKSVTVHDSGGNPIFRVNENGDLQGKTGKTLTFNL